MVDIQHKNITGLDAAHPPFYASETDPTTTLGAYRVWFKPSTGEYWVRNAANTAWIDPVTAGGGGGSGGHTIQDEGSSLTARTNLNFTGAGVTVTDDSANDQTDVTIPGGTADPASETTAGIIEIATQAETDAGVDDARAITPEKLAGRIASETQSGVIEVATQTETNTGTDDTRAVTPAKFAGRTSTETRPGVIELATQAETNTGTDDTRAVTPLKLKTNVDLHINDTTDAHDASAISILDTAAQYTATNAEDALAEVLDGLQAHEADTTDAHDATAISFVPAGSVAATNVQAAIEEVAGESGGGGSAHVIKDEGSALTQRANLNFVGAGVTATDDAGNSETEVTIPGASAASESTAGVLEIATQGETNTGTDDTRAVTPLKLANYSGLGGGGGSGNISGAYDIEAGTYTDAGMSDEFASGTLDAKWTTALSSGTIDFPGQPGSACYDLTSRSGTLLLQPAYSTSAVQTTTMRQADGLATGESLVLSCALPYLGKYTSATYTYVGLLFNTSTTYASGTYNQFRVIVNFTGANSSAATVEVTTNVAAQRSVAINTATSNRVYLRVSRKTINSIDSFVWLFSVDGMVWTQVWQSTAAAFTQMWLSTETNTQTNPSISPVYVVNWIRHVASTAHDLW